MQIDGVTLHIVVIAAPLSLCSRPVAPNPVGTRVPAVPFAAPARLKIECSLARMLNIRDVAHTELGPGYAQHVLTRDVVSARLACRECCHPCNRLQRGNKIQLALEGKIRPGSDNRMAAIAVRD